MRMRSHGGDHRAATFGSAPHYYVAINDDQRPRRVVLLGRVSTDDKGQDPENQLGPLRAAAARLSWTVVVEIPLEISAWDATAAAEVKRRVLAPIVDGRANVLMVWALDRVCRGGIEAAFAFLRELEEHLGADFYSLQEPFLCTAGTDKQTRELMIALLSWLAKWESERKSERLKATVRTKRNRAAALGKRAGWGGGTRGGNGGALASAEDIERVHALKRDGRSVRAIAAEVGLSKSQVGRILETPAAG
jgi:DNA invertase Pin-like site-specific DNA recombinase